jgi:hypothetical protein
MLYDSVLWKIYVVGNNKAYLGLHVKCPTLVSDLNQIWIFSRERERYIYIYRSPPPHIRFHRNPSSGEVITELTGVFRYCVN